MQRLLVTAPRSPATPPPAIASGAGCTRHPASAACRCHAGQVRRPSAAAGNKGTHTNTTASVKHAIARRSPPTVCRNKPVPLYLELAGSRKVAPARLEKDILFLGMLTGGYHGGCNSRLILRVRLFKRTQRQLEVYILYGCPLFTLGWTDRYARPDSISKPEFC
jgi:hypothetical protein